MQLNYYFFTLAFDVVTLQLLLHGFPVHAGCVEKFKSLVRINEL